MSECDVEAIPSLDFESFGAGRDENNENLVDSFAFGAGSCENKELEDAVELFFLFTVNSDIRYTVTS